MSAIKGNTSPLIFWLATGSTGLVATMALAFSSGVNNDLAKQADAQTVMVQRVSVIETKGNQYTADISELKVDVKNTATKSDLEKLSNQVEDLKGLVQTFVSRNK